MGNTDRHFPTWGTSMMNIFHARQTRRSTRTFLIPLVCLCLTASSRADQTVVDVGRLEALLAARNDELCRLEILVADRTQDVEEQRVEALKQQIREVLGEQDFRESLTSTRLQAGYDGGFFIKSSDEKFTMFVNGYMQFRWTHYQAQKRNRYLTPEQRRNDRTGFDVERLRLQFSGSVYSPDLTYYFELLGDGPADYDLYPLYAYVDYGFSDAFHVMLGMLPLVSTRQSWLDERGYLFVDRPMTDIVFTLGDGVGVQFWGTLLEKKLEYYLVIANSMNSTANRTITNDPPDMDNNPAVTFRAIWHALGEDPDDWTFEGDVGCSESPMLDFGFHYGFDDDHGDVNTTTIPFPVTRRPLGMGGYDATSTNGLQINQFGLDAAFRYRGCYISGEYVLRIVDPRRAGRQPFTPWTQLTGQADTTVMHGACLTAGYFLPIPGMEDKFEAVARVGGISTLANGQEGTWEYGAGLNYYLNGAEAGHMTKLQFDVTRIYEVPVSNEYSSMAEINDDALVFRIQLQVGF